ncbi:MAG TPA: helix-turn-helix transcriptional regulator [Tissierellia bacterium]|nr:helix-turn-helix transcriptional regulator [Tissierellia bacterium]
MKSSILQGYEYIQSLLRSKWVPEIIEGLSDGHNRFSLLKRNIDQIGDTELKRKLKYLVDAGVVDKTGLGHQVRYSLTPFGMELDHLFSHIRDIGHRYHDGVASSPTTMDPY